VASKGGTASPPRWHAKQARNPVLRYLNSAHAQIREAQARAAAEDVGMDGRERQLNARALADAQEERPAAGM
jgi:hypothetical protein